MSSENGGRSDRRCLRCALHAAAEADAENLAKYIDAIRPEDKAGEDRVEERLAVCFACEKKQGITCMACGCYLEIRASLRDARCPKSKW